MPTGQLGCVSFYFPNSLKGKFLSFRFAFEKGYVIEHLGVSKPPCCMCDTLLSNEKNEPAWKFFESPKAEQQHGAVEEDKIKQYYHDVHAKVFPTGSKPVASGPQKVETTTASGTGTPFS